MPAPGPSPRPAACSRSSRSDPLPVARCPSGAPCRGGPSAAASIWPAAQSQLLRFCGQLSPYRHHPAMQLHLSINPSPQHTPRLGCVAAHCIELMVRDLRVVSCEWTRCSARRRLGIQRRIWTLPEAGDALVGLPIADVTSATHLQPPSQFEQNQSGSVTVHFS